MLLLLLQKLSNRRSSSTRKRHNHHIRPSLSYLHINGSLVERESVVPRSEVIPKYKQSVLNIYRPAQSSIQLQSPDFLSGIACAVVPGVSAAREECVAAVCPGRDVANTQDSGFFLDAPIAAGVEHLHSLISVKTLGTNVSVCSRIKSDANISGGVGKPEDQVAALQAKAPTCGGSGCRAE